MGPLGTKTRPKMSWVQISFSLIALYSPGSQRTTWSHVDFVRGGGAQINSLVSFKTRAGSALVFRLLSQVRSARGVRTSIWADAPSEEAEPEP